MNSWRLLHHHSKNVWRFLWNDDSVWSLLANVIVAFLLIRFIAYPFLGVVMGTSYPIVAVVSESMEHGSRDGLICGHHMDTFPESFANYWEKCGQWYEDHNISKPQFAQFQFRDGFNTGDIIILRNARAKNLHIGDVLVFQGGKPQPIIHRIVRIYEEDGALYYQTKGDHNSDSIVGSGGETQIAESRLLGKGLFRIPYLGWVKILFVDAVKPLGIEIKK